jgi:hypothetical protein
MSHCQITVKIIVSDGGCGCGGGGDDGDDVDDDNEKLLVL